MILPPIHVLETQELTAEAASITFTLGTLVTAWDSFSSVTSRHLVFLISGRDTTAATTDGLALRFNADATNTYTYQLFDATDTTVSAGIGAADSQLNIGLLPGASAPSGVFGGGVILVPHAFNAANHKAVIALSGSYEDYLRMGVGRWASVSAITSITLLTTTNNLAIGTRISLAVVDERYLIEEDLLSGSDGLPVFDSIPQEEGDLVAIGYARSDVADGVVEDEIIHEINDDAVAGNYPSQELLGRGAAETASQPDQEIAMVAGTNATANVFGAFIVQYSQFAKGTNDPHFLSLSGYHETTGPTAEIRTMSGRRDNVEAITKLEYIPLNGTNFKDGSLFSLYRVPRVLIRREELAADTAAITFDAIDKLQDDYEALVLNVYARTDQADVTDSVNVAFNNDTTAANYDWQRLYAATAAIAALRSAANRVVIMNVSGDTDTANKFNGGSILIPCYTKSNRHKHFMELSGKGETNVFLTSHRWESTAAITEIDLTPLYGDNFKTGSIFELWGILPITATKASYRVDIAFDSDPLDDNPDYTNVASDALSIHISRGRRHELNRFEAGTAKVLLNNASGNYWPGNTGGDYSPNVKLRKKLRIWAVSQGADYPLYTGFIQAYKPQWLDKGQKGPCMLLECTDLMKIMSKLPLNDDTGYAQELSGTRIGNVLDDVGVGSLVRVVDVGQQEMLSTGAMANIMAMTHAYDIVESEITQFYINKEGLPAYEDRSHRANAPHDSALAIFGDDSGEMEYVNANLVLDDVLLYNEIRATRTGGTEQTASDGTKQTTYGHSGLVYSGIWLIADAAVKAFCLYLLARYSDMPEIRADSITLLPQGHPANLWHKALSYEISDRITYRLNANESDDDYFIEGIDLRYDSRQDLTEIRWMLSDAARYNFTPDAIEDTLRPDAPGDETNLPQQHPDSTSHWDKVDEATPDEGATYVYTNDESIGVVRDLYNVGAPPYPNGTINSVTIYARCDVTTVDATPGYAYVCCKTGGTAHDESLTTLTTTWQNISKAYTLNPTSSAAWTWAEITALQVGVKMFPTLLAGFANGLARCTQAYAVVNYTPAW